MAHPVRPCWKYLDDMNDDLQSQTTLALFRYTIRLHCRHEVTKGLLLGSLSKDPAALAKMTDEMERQAKILEEQILLKVGDSNPQGADLLGVQEFLRKL